MRLKAWLSSSLVRVFPAGPAGGPKRLSLAAARNSRVSFQVSLRHEGDDPLEVRCTVRTPVGLDATVRRVGCVPVAHHNTRTPQSELDGRGFIPGYVPDPLFPEDFVTLAPSENTSFWVTVRVDAGARPGMKRIAVTLASGRQSLASLAVTVCVSPVVLEPRRDFRVTHWFYADAIAEWYRVQPFSAEFWPICRKYMRDCAEHGSDLIYVPVFTPPLDGVKRPTQLLRVRESGRGEYRFDWRDVRRWIAEAKGAGLRRFEWTHLFTQWGAKYAIRIYRGQGQGESLLWPAQTPGVSPTYRRFLGQYLPALRRFLLAEGLMDASYFHLSDEPHGPEHRENYRAARAMLRELAPWMRVMDALSEIEFGREGLVDTPIPSIRTTRAFARENIASWTYFCCGPRGRYLNRLLDTPLAKIRMSGPLFYRFGVGGFLHWGYNYWYKSQSRELIDPFAVTDGLKWPNWAYGDPFLVYPGAAGPIDSIRWEAFAESLDDYALLQTLGVKREGRLLSPLRDFDDFPKDGRWLARARNMLLNP